MTVTAQERPKAPLPDHVPADRVFDFDLYYDDRLKGDPQKGLMTLHADAPDLFYTQRNGGYWVATRFADVTKIMMNAKVFSSADAFARPIPQDMRVQFVPLHMDAPEHMRHRLLLLKFLGPKEVRKLDGEVRELIVSLIEGLAGRSACEFRSEIAIPIPVSIFLKIMDWDVARFRDFNEWADKLTEAADLETAAPAAAQMTKYLREVIALRMETPGDDPVSLLLASQINGEQVTPQRVYEFCHLLFLAGLDTVVNAITFITYHFATHPELQQRLRANPDQIPRALEELLRRYAFTNIARRVTEDIEINGALLKKGDTVVCSLAAASNDDRSVPHPDQVDLDRPESPHVAFNTGPHACVGASLARMELRIFIEEWLRRMPDIHLAPGFTPESRAGTVMALKSLEITW